MRIGVQGIGVVGSTLRRWLIKNTNHEVLAYDPEKGFNDNLNFCEAIFICIPVPTLTHGVLHLKPLVEAVNQWGENIPIFVKSTVLPGVCDDVGKLTFRNLIAMPEFLTERQADKDFADQPVLVGTIGKDLEIAELVRRIFLNKEIIEVTNKEAELAKYAHNCFAAVKVNYFNMIYEFCRLLDVSYESVKLGFMLSGLINEPHTMVPGPDGATGFGGKCLPKDLDAFCTWIKDRDAFGYAVCRQTLLENRRRRKE